MLIILAFLPGSWLVDSLTPINVATNATVPLHPNLFTTSGFSSSVITFLALFAVLSPPALFDQHSGPMTMKANCKTEIDGEITLKLLGLQSSTTRQMWNLSVLFLCWWIIFIHTFIPWYPLWLKSSILVRKLKTQQNIIIIKTSTYCMYHFPQTTSQHDHITQWMSNYIHTCTE